MQILGRGSEIPVGKDDLEQINSLAITKAVTQLSEEKETLAQLRAELLINANLQSFHLRYCTLSSNPSPHQMRAWDDSDGEINKPNSLKGTEFTVTSSEARVIYEVTYIDDNHHLFNLNANRLKAMSVPASTDINAYSIIAGNSWRHPSKP